MTPDDTEKGFQGIEKKEVTFEMLSDRLIHQAVEKLPASIISVIVDSLAPKGYILGANLQVSVAEDMTTLVSTNDNKIFILDTMRIFHFDDGDIGIQWAAIYEGKSGITGEKDLLGAYQAFVPKALKTITDELNGVLSDTLADCGYVIGYNATARHLVSDGTFQIELDKQPVFNMDPPKIMNQNNVTVLQWRIREPRTKPQEVH